MLYQDDTLTIQKITSTSRTSIGGVTNVWGTAAIVTGDAQPYNKEKLYREYGLTASNEMKRVFAPVNAEWQEGRRCLLGGVAYRILRVDAWDNHCEVLLERVS